MHSIAYNDKDIFNATKDLKMLFIWTFLLQNSTQKRHNFAQA